LGLFGVRTANFRKTSQFLLAWDAYLV